jgi:hypothetical protein
VDRFFTLLPGEEEKSAPARKKGETEPALAVGFDETVQADGVLLGDSGRPRW